MLNRVGGISNLKGPSINYVVCVLVVRDVGRRWNGPPTQRQPVSPRGDAKIAFGAIHAVQQYVY